MTMIGRAGWSGLASLALMVLAHPAEAQVSGVTTSGGTVNANGYPGTLGYRFQVTAANMLTGLGYYDDQMDGLKTAHAVGLWDSSGNLLRSATVPSGTSATLLDSFRYVDVTPYDFVVGQTYTVGGYAITDAYTFGGTQTTAAGISYTGNAYLSGSSLADPTNTGGGASSGYFGGNIRLAAAAPEPAAWTLMILGFGMTGGALRRQKRAKAEGTPLAANT